MQGGRRHVERHGARRDARCRGPPWPLDPAHPATSRTSRSRGSCQDIMPMLADPLANGGDRYARGTVARHRNRRGDGDRGARLPARRAALAPGTPAPGWWRSCKPGKLPGRVIEQRYALEYGEDALQVQADALPPGARVLLVDDVLATGGTLAATTRTGGCVTGRRESAPRCSSVISSTGGRAGPATRRCAPRGCPDPCTGGRRRRASAPWSTLRSQPSRPAKYACWSSYIAMWLPLGRYR